MPRREQATAAADLLIVDHPSARDVAVVEQRFHLHPLDLEALFSVPKKSSGQAYGEYFRLALTWPELIGGQLLLADAVFFVRPDALAVVSHHPSPTLTAVLNVWVHGAQSDQRSPLELVADCLNVVARSVEASAAAAAIDPAIMAELTAAIHTLSVVPAHLAMTLPPAVTQRLAMAQHRIKYAGEKMIAEKRMLRGNLPPNRRLGRLVRGYALASAGLALLVIAAVAR